MGFLVMFVTEVCLLFLLKLRWTKNKGVYDILFIEFFEILEPKQDLACTEKKTNKYHFCLK